jgi:hypothetical protein
MNQNDNVLNNKSFFMQLSFRIEILALGMLKSKSYISEVEE